MRAFECVKISPTESTEVFTISTSNLNETRRDIESHSTKITYDSSKTIWWTLLTDLPLLGLYFLITGLFELGVIPNHKGGFYCHDIALNHTFTGDTVAAEVLMPTLFLLPIIVFIPTEYIYRQCDFLGQSRLRLALRSTFYLYRSYIYGILLNLAIVQVMKGIVGSPRPTFFDLCQPDAEKTCVGSEFVSDFTCTSKVYSSWYQMDSYRSFPSGHSSMSVFCGFFLAWYLQRRAFNWTYRSTFLVPTLQMLCIGYAALCSLTRITDHRHHWWDVLFGAGIGLATVYYAVMPLSNDFTYSCACPSCDGKTDRSQTTMRTLLYEENRRGTIP